MTVNVTSSVVRTGWVMGDDTDLSVSSPNPTSDPSEYYPHPVVDQIPVVTFEDEMQESEFDDSLHSSELEESEQESDSVEESESDEKSEDLSEDSSDTNSVEDCQLNSFVIRINPYDKFTREHILEFMTTKFPSSGCNWVIAEEHKPNFHYHIVLQTLCEMKEVREIIREYVCQFWYDKTTGKLPRGFGNKQYNLQACRDLDSAVSYALKDRKWSTYSGFASEYMEQRLAASFPRKKAVDFNTEFRQLRDNFIDVRTFMVGYSNLCGKYDRMLNMNYAYNYALSCSVRVFSNADDLVDEYLLKFGK